MIVRVPYLTSFKTINRIVREKYGWLLKHRDNYRRLDNSSLNKSYTTGEIHFFHGDKTVLKIEKSGQSYIRFNNNTFELGLERTDDPLAIKRLLYKGYKNEALIVFPELMNKVLREHENQMFKPAGLVIRTMKRRWGSCSSKGIITLSTELIKLADQYIEYVIIP